MTANPSRFRDVFAQMTRFGISGLILTCFHTGIALALIRLTGATSAVANGVAFIVATTLSYLINTRWSFSSVISRRTLWRFLVVSLVGLVLAVAISSLAASQHLDDLFGILCVAVAVPPITFIIHRFWTYR
jgi:putative flippase GtrA